MSDYPDAEGILGNWLPPSWRKTCEFGPHRGPEGPNEDIALCHACLGVSWSKRPAGETFGWHADDCSLPVDHESYCQPGGSGHPAAAHIRGYWPDDPRSPDYRRG